MKKLVHPHDLIFLSLQETYSKKSREPIKQKKEATPSNLCNEIQDIWKVASPASKIAIVLGLTYPSILMILSLTNTNY
jgi:hypothetical protein